MEVVLETLSGRRLIREPIDPRASDVESAIFRLDGRNTTLLLLDAGNQKLFIGGGPNCYSVLAQTSEDDFYNLVGEPSLEGSQDIVLGGQRVDFPRRLLVPRDRVVQSAKGFVVKGNFVLTPDWERAGPEVQPAR